MPERSSSATHNKIAALRQTLTQDKGPYLSYGLEQGGNASTPSINLTKYSPPIGQKYMDYGKEQNLDLSKIKAISPSLTYATAPPAPVINPNYVISGYVLYGYVL